MQIRLYISLLSSPHPSQLKDCPSDFYLHLQSNPNSLRHCAPPHLTGFPFSLGTLLLCSGRSRYTNLCPVVLVFQAPPLQAFTCSFPSAWYLFLPHLYSLLDNVSKIRSALCSQSTLYPFCIHHSSKWYICWWDHLMTYIIPLYWQHLKAGTVFQSFASSAYSTNLGMEVHISWVKESINKWM